MKNSSRGLTRVPSGQPGPGIQAGPMRHIGMQTGDISLPAVSTALKAGVPSGKQPAGLLGGCKSGNGIEKSGKTQVS
ncbi:MAG: hypothetical protein ACP5O7_13160 [Phycisphaerae bacterium]